MDALKLGDTCLVCGTRIMHCIKRHTAFCTKVRMFLNKYDLSAERLAFAYQELGSVLAVQQKYPFDDKFSFYYLMFEKLSIKVSVKEAANHAAVKEKHFKTNLSRTGFVSPFSAGSPAFVKIRAKLAAEGFSNVFQKPDVKLKSVQTLLSRYGEEAWRKFDYPIRGRSVLSSVSKKVCEILSQNSIPFHIEKKILKPNGVAFYSYDIIIDNTTKLIEVNGDYWHGNPQLYTEKDLFMRGSSRECAMGDIWTKDKKKLDYASEKVYSVLVVWEQELKITFEATKERILAYARSKD